jgi:carbon storage regulator
MLVLTRRPGERLCIGNDIVITFLRTRGKSTRIGITCPSQIRIRRAELEELTPSTPSMTSASARDDD